ncbi:MAG TPA: hypothetical protein VLF69_06490 [Candidatus Saccharimonadales bacterium]|nr:hypothetical protein [Candidatus Saccharimonadales bacterium]
MTHTINTPVSVSSYYFAGREMKTFPRQIEYGGQAITFMNGLRYLVQRGAEAIRLFDMSGADGLTYRLQQTGDNWMLLGTRGAL